MSTRATIEIIERPNLSIHIYEELREALSEKPYVPIRADIWANGDNINIKLADSRDEYEDTPNDL